MVSELEQYYYCPECGETLTQIQCKMKCEKCGYTESCEDLWNPPVTAKQE